MPQEKSLPNIGTSIFWTMIILVLIAGLVYQGIWAYQNNSVRASIITFLFMFLILISIVLSKFEVFNLGTWGSNTLGFTIGFTIWSFISGFGQQSVLSVSQNALMSTISSELPQVIEIMMNGIVVPIAEELFWMIAIPFSIISIMSVLGKKYSIFKNGWLQLSIIVIIGGITFATFHVAKFVLAFLISAFIFRSVMIISVWGDKLKDIFPAFNSVVAFALGGHIGNNLSTYGYGQVFTVMNSNLGIGIIVYLFFGVIFIGALNQIGNLISGART